MREISTFFDKYSSIRASSFLLLFFFIFASSKINSQVLGDSLYTELNLLAQIDTQKFNIEKERLQTTLHFSEKDYCLLEELEGNKYHYHGDEYTAKKHYVNALECAKDKKNKSVELSTRTKVCWLELGMGLIKLEEAIGVVDQIYIDATAVKDTNNMLLVLNAIAGFNNNLGKKDESYEYYILGMKLSSDPKFYLMRATLLNNFGLLKMNNNLKEEGFKDLKEGLRLIENKKEIRIKTRLINNIAFYFERDSLGKDSATYYFNKTLEIGRITKEPAIFLVAYTNIAVSYNLMGDPKTSLMYYDSALAVVETHYSPGLKGKIYLGMADLYQRQNNYPKALSLIKKALKIVNSEDYDKLDDLVGIEKFFSNVYDEMGNSKASLLHYKKYNTLRDSVEKSNNQKFLAELNLKYEDEKKQAEIEKQKNRADIAEKKHDLIQSEADLSIMRNSFIFISIILLIAIFFFIYIFRSISAKKKMEQKFAANLISDIENERQRISSDLHDHIGLNLILVKNQLSKSESNSKVVEDVSHIVDDVRKISRDIYPSQLNKLGIRKSLESMFDRIEDRTGIICSYEIDDLDQLSFTKNEELILYRIVQELSNNSIKHSKSKSIRLTSKITQKKLNLLYQDNGIGFDKSKTLETSSGMGLRNIINRVEKIGGTISFDTRKNQGLKVNINIERQRKS